MRDWRRGISFAELALGLLFVVFAARALLMASPPDTFWHLRAGGDIVRLHAVPRTESYSFTAVGWPWWNHEWLWEAGTHVSWRAGGFPLLTIYGAAFVIAAMALVYRLTTGPAWTRFILLMVGLALTMPAWGVRPHLFTLFAVPLLLTLLVREIYWPLPPLFVLWSNTHGGVAHGGVLLGVATAVAFLRWGIRRTREARRRALILSVVLALCAAVSLATPFGTAVFRLLAESMVRIHAIGVGEWQPTFPNDPYNVIFWLLAIAFVVLAVKRRRSLLAGDAGSWADWLLVGCALALIPVAVAALRNVPLFLLVATPAASRLLGPDARIRLRAPRAARADDDKPIVNLALLAGASLAAGLAVGWCYARSIPALGWRPIDDRALAAVRAGDGPLYNQYDEGGYLIWFVPDKPVFMDNRTDPYPLALTRSQLDVQWGATPYRPLFERWGIRCAFLPMTSRTVADLDRDGWVTRFRDSKYTVLSAPLPR